MSDVRLKRKRYISPILEIADKAQRLAERWLRYGIVKGWESCGCRRCKELMEAVQ